MLLPPPAAASASCRLRQRGDTGAEATPEWLAVSAGPRGDSDNRWRSSMARRSLTEPLRDDARECARLAALPRDLPPEAPAWALLFAASSAAEMSMEPRGALEGSGEGGSLPSNEYECRLLLAASPLLASDEKNGLPELWPRASGLTVTGEPPGDGGPPRASLPLVLLRGLRAAWRPPPPLPEGGAR